MITFNVIERTFFNAFCGERKIGRKIRNDIIGIGK